MSISPFKKHGWVSHLEAPSARRRQRRRRPRRFGEPNKGSHEEQHQTLGRLNHGETPTKYWGNPTFGLFPKKREVETQNNMGAIAVGNWFELPNPYMNVGKASLELRMEFPNHFWENHADPARDPPLYRLCAYIYVGTNFKHDLAYQHVL